MIQPPTFFYKIQDSLVSFSSTLLLAYSAPVTLFILQWLKRVIMCCWFFSLIDQRTHSLISFKYLFSPFVSETFANQYIKIVTPPTPSHTFLLCFPLSTYHYQMSPFLTHFFNCLHSLECQTQKRKGTCFPSFLSFSFCLSPLLPPFSFSCSSCSSFS